MEGPWYEREQELEYFKSRAMEWISVSEKMPDVLDTFLVAVEFTETWGETTRETHFATYDPDYLLGECDDRDKDPFWWEGWSFHSDIWEGQKIHVTHWMPLPKPPKEDSNDVYVLINPVDLPTPEEMSKNLGKHINEMVKRMADQVFKEET